MSKVIRPSVHIRRPARVATIAGVVTLLAMTLTTPANGQQAAAAPEPTSPAFLRTQDVDPPQRSRSIDSVSLRDGCGEAEGGLVTVDGRPDDWAGEPTWIAGTERYDNGEYI